MTRFIFVITAFLFAGCGDSSDDVKRSQTSSDSAIKLAEAASRQHDADEAADTTDYENATYYIVVADTGLDYDRLRQKMLSLNNDLRIPIDTMGRLYNKSKNLIALPDNDEDEEYAGQYYPRRFPSEHFSLEYLAFYDREAGEKTIALVSGIYENESRADSAMIVLRKSEKEAFKIKADIFIGCMH